MQSSLILKERRPGGHFLREFELVGHCQYGAVYFFFDNKLLFRSLQIRLENARQFLRFFKIC